MKKRFSLALALFTSASMLMSCNSNEKPANQQTATTEQDHAGHDHAGHDHTAHAQQAPMNQQAAPAASVPDFTFYILKSGIKVTKADLSKEKNSVFLLFDPGCGHCQQEATALEQNKERLKNVDLYFVSMNDPALILGFWDTFMPKLGHEKNVEVLFDKGQEFIQKFHVPNQFPANYVYGPDGKLKAYWEGDKNVNEAIAEFTK